MCLQSADPTEKLFSIHNSYDMLDYLGGLSHEFAMHFHTNYAHMDVNNTYLILTYMI